MGSQMDVWNRLDDLEATIQEGYESLGYRTDGDRGYRFLASPTSTIGANRLIMSVNPAGNEPDWENDALFTADGQNAYVDERWLAAPTGSSKLQIQYQALFSFLDWEPSKVMLAPLSPYRYPSWSKIPSRMQRLTVEFCVNRIWQPYFEKYTPSQIISVGKPPVEAICLAIGSEVSGAESASTGWHNRACATATTYFFDNGTVMVQIPHLSRFGIMTTPVCTPHLARIFAALF